MDLTNLLPDVVTLAKQAGAILREGYGTAVESRGKDGRHNLVTEYDLRVESFLFDALRELAPGSGFLGEEGGAVEGVTDLQWVVDPLDGTVNFAHGIPIFCTSIGAVVNGTTELGVIYHPLLDETFTALRGSGAWLNGRKIGVSATTELSNAILVTGFPYNVSTNPEACIDQFAAIVGRGLPVRRLGSAALDLAYTAAGRFDAFWEVHLNAWDMAAGALLVEEAGGRVTHYHQRPFTLGHDSIIATNGHLHAELAEALADATLRSKRGGL